MINLINMHSITREKGFSILFIEKSNEKKIKD